MADPEPPGHAVQAGASSTAEKVLAGQAVQAVAPCDEKLPLVHLKQAEATK